MKLRSLLEVLLLILLLSVIPTGKTQAEDCNDPVCPPPIIECTIPTEARSPGFWKNHPDDWRKCAGDVVNSLDAINICCEEGVPCDPIGCQMLTKVDAIAMMEQPVAQDKFYTMFDALVAAQLNRLAGAFVPCTDGADAEINNTIHYARVWLCENWGVPVPGSSDAWQEAEAWYETLDYYNNYGCVAP